jgi:hypothetical protein
VHRTRNALRRLWSGNISLRISPALFMGKMGLWWPGKATGPIREAPSDRPAYRGTCY